MDEQWSRGGYYWTDEMCYIGWTMVTWQAPLLDGRKRASATTVLGERKGASTTAGLTNERGECYRVHWTEGECYRCPGRMKMTGTIARRTRRANTTYYMDGEVNTTGLVEKRAP